MSALSSVDSRRLRRCEDVHDRREGVESFRDFVAAVNAGFVGQVGGLRNHIATCHPSNVAEASARLEQAEAGLGETLFDVI